MACCENARIRNYLNRWVTWWTMTSTTWEHQELLQRFIDVCWHEKAAAHAVALIHIHYFKTLHARSIDGLDVAA